MQRKKQSGGQQTLELEVGDEAVVGRDGIDTSPLPQVPDVDRVVITTSSHMVPTEHNDEVSNLLGSELESELDWAQNHTLSQICFSSECCLIMQSNTHNTHVPCIT